MFAIPVPDLSGPGATLLILILYGVLLAGVFGIGYGVYRLTCRRRVGK